MKDTVRDISITEIELDLLVELLLKEEKRCHSNAKETKRGFGLSSNSFEKYAKWTQRADDCNELASKLSERFI